MRLADFLDQNRDSILEEWTRFATTLEPFDSRTSPEELRNDAARVLAAIAADLRRAQEPQAQHAKSQGRSDAGAVPEADEHGRVRQRSGLSAVAVASEFRALRATVLRLWLPVSAVLDAQGVDDLVRFNEAVDQAQSGALRAFSVVTERERNLLMGVVAHDLRGPLQAVVLLGEIVLRNHPPLAKVDAFASLRRAAARMGGIVNDLQTVIGGRLERALAVHPAPMDLAEVAEQVVAEATAEYRDHRFLLDAERPMAGEWDRERLAQVLSNLIRNAAAHGSAGGTIRVRLRSSEDGPRIEVHNQGAPIPAEDRERLFEALTQGRDRESDTLHMGLGLYIVREIVRGHGGSVFLESEDATGTTFTVRLPWRVSFR
ncbi:ATP-binding protein [Tahibacter sp. UC22_41]|uniref:ATP-binding protein n=1 Tax=Tahibacter sp. UC22_41 TaxID=3350178 RepID=UPI0036DB82DE